MRQATQMNSKKYSPVETKVNEEEEMEPVVALKKPPLPRGETVATSFADDLKAQHWKYAQYGVVFIICISYFIYQVTLFADTDTNRRISASIDPMQTLEIPFFSITAGVPLDDLTVLTIPHPNSNLTNFTNVCPIFLITDTTTLNLSAFNNTHNWTPCQIQTKDDVYSKDTDKWTIIKNGTRDMMIYPPYEKTMGVDQSLMLLFFTRDTINNQSMSRAEYLELTDDDPLMYQLSWVAEHTNFVKNNNFLKVDEGIVASWMRKSKQTIVASVQHYEIDVLNTNYFGDVETRYSTHIIYQGPTQSPDCVFVHDNSWYHATGLLVSANTLGTETTITFSKKLTFLDCVSKTGGIFGLVFPASVVILKYLLSGFGIKKCRIPGIAPKAGFTDEEKRKVLTYLKEIKVV
eukprot:48107_1